MRCIDAGASSRTVALTDADIVSGRRPWKMIVLLVEEAPGTERQKKAGEYLDTGLHHTQFLQQARPVAVETLQSGVSLRSLRSHSSSVEITRHRSIVGAPEPAGQPFRVQEVASRQTTGFSLVDRLRRTFAWRRSKLMTADTPSPITEPRWFAAALARQTRTPRCADRRLPRAPSLLGRRRPSPASCWSTVDRRIRVGGTTSPRSSRRSHRVVAIDLSGHGDSEIREQYPMDQLDERGPRGGHGRRDLRQALRGRAQHGRMGDRGTRRAAHRCRRGPGHHRLTSVRRTAGGDHHPAARPRPEGAMPNKDEICVRFRTEPRQDVLLPYVGQARRRRIGEGDRGRVDVEVRSGDVPQTARSRAAW